MPRDLGSRRRSQERRLGHRWQAAQDRIRKDPTTGFGMSDALGSAEMLADAVDDALGRLAAMG